MKTEGLSNGLNQPGYPPSTCEGLRNPISSPQPGPSQNPQNNLAYQLFDQSQGCCHQRETKKTQRISKASSKKERLKFLKVQIPENVHGMISAVHQHFWFLTNIPHKYLENLPAPTTPEERKMAVEAASHLCYLTAETCNDPFKEIQSQVLHIYCQSELHKLGLQRFPWDWESSWQHQFNELMTIIFYHTFFLALVSTEYHHFC
ncbi:hypothetical protein O181_086440 [Austropuccinia psidii MF-1]|uniref:Uncharacterized protein n=1 Tax=Austropuccinia psidii MF-1 TaxID=1389203 RepID=A0A9Q3FZ99_9BASI|nr:hypothetical protein [Austropuccinia psidii MF-1]